MANLQVELRPPTAQNRLYHSHNGYYERSLLTLVSIQRGRRTYTINLDGLVLMDLDANHALRTVEVTIERDGWRVAPPPDLPHPIPAANVVFVNLVGEGELVEGRKVAVFTDAQFSFAYITLDAQPAQLKWVALSDHVFAALAAGYLYGFYVRLPTAQPAAGR
jgi:hypothetical protein